MTRPRKEEIVSKNDKDWAKTGAVVDASLVFFRTHRETGFVREFQTPGKQAARTHADRRISNDPFTGHNVEKQHLVIDMIIDKTVILRIVFCLSGVTVVFSSASGTGGSSWSN